MESFGFKLYSIKIENLDGKITEINYSENGCSSKINFQQLPQNDKTTIRALLYIMDKCCVGDSAYHEMSMLVDGLPRSYLIKQCRNAQNAISHITRTAGKHPGAQMSYKGELREQIRNKVIFPIMSRSIPSMPIPSLGICQAFSNSPVIRVGYFPQQVFPGWGIGTFQKTSIPPPLRKLDVNPPTPSDVLIHLLLSESILSPLPLRTAEISSMWGVLIFSGMTHLLQCLQRKQMCIPPRDH
jgi:hypothetical protein